MSITNDDIKTEWEPGDTLVVTMDGDGDGSDGGEASDGDGSDGDGAAGDDGADGDGGDADGGDRLTSALLDSLPAVGHDAWTACRVPHPDAPGIGDLVADPDAFVAADLFRRAVWSAAGEAARDPERFATVEALWDDVLTRGLRAPMFRLVRDGETLAPSQYCRSAGVGHRTLDDVVRPNRVVELHRQGATLVLQGLQLTDPHLGRFANNLALALDHPVQVNAYLTPRAATGLELHFDFHDVFVVQLAGRKRWRVWLPLARTADPVRRGPRPLMPTFDELGPPALDLMLAAGDCLYLPRGFPHAAEAVDAASSHLTVGVMAVTWQKVLIAAVDAALAEPGLRASLPAGVLAGADPGRPALDALVAQLDPALVRAWLADEIWRRQPATRLAPVVAPPAACRVRVTPGPLLWLRTDGARTVLGLGDRHLTLPAEAHGFLAALLASPDGFDVDGWAGALDDASRAVVVERLAAEGVVVPA